MQSNERRNGAVFSAEAPPASAPTPLASRAAARTDPPAAWAEGRPPYVHPPCIDGGGGGGGWGGWGGELWRPRPAGRLVGVLLPRGGDTRSVVGPPVPPDHPACGRPCPPPARRRLVAPSPPGRRAPVPCCQVGLPIGTGANGRRCAAAPTASPPFFPPPPTHNVRGVGGLGRPLCGWVAGRRARCAGRRPRRAGRNRRGGRPPAHPGWGTVPPATPPPPPPPPSPSPPSPPPPRPPPPVATGRAGCHVSGHRWERLDPATAAAAKPCTAGSAGSGKA